jgi:hypothetical protein
MGSLEVSERKKNDPTSMPAIDPIIGMNWCNHGGWVTSPQRNNVKNELDVC